MFLVLPALLIAGCKSPAKPTLRQPEIGWRPVASWSGSGNTQTDSFYMDSGQWRIRWQATDQKSSAPGRFQAIVHSTVSGRFVEVAADQQGSGSGVHYMAEEPRQFFLVIELTGVDWKIAVDEGVIADKGTQ